MPYTKIRFMQLQKIYIFFLLCFFSSCNGQTQNTNKAIATSQRDTLAIPIHKIEYINLNKATSFVDKIEFKDDKEKLISTFDVKANNPFNKYDLPSERYNTFGGKVYNLKDIPIKRVEQLLGDTKASTTSRSANRKRDITFNAAESQTIIYPTTHQRNLYQKTFLEKNEFVLITYNLFLYDAVGETFESQSEIVLLDKTGKEVQRLRLPHIARVPLVTNDGQFLIANYGGAYTCSDFQYVENGFNVYELSSGNLIYYESRKGLSNTNPAIIYDIFSYPIRSGGRKILYKVYDFNKKILFEKELGYATFLKGGMRIKNEEGKYVNVTYEESFQKSPLKLTK